MLKSNASRVVLGILLAITALELSGKIGQIWKLAFTGAVPPDTASASGPQQSGSSNTPPGLPPIPQIPGVNAF